MTAVNNRIALDPQDITVPTSTQRYGIGERAEFVGNSDGTVSEYVYCVAHTTLTAYVPYEVYHNGTTLTTMTPLTGTALIVVPQVDVTSAYYFWGLIKGNGTCAIGAETYAVGDQLEVIDSGAVSNVDGSTGVTVRTSNSFAVSKVDGTTATNISVYLYGNSVSDIAAS